MLKTSFVMVRFSRIADCLIWPNNITIRLGYMRTIVKYTCLKLQHKTSSGDSLLYIIIKRQLSGWSIKYSYLFVCTEIDF